MRISDIIINAIPNADETLCEFILWERTPYPFKKLSAKDIYKAAYRYKRAADNGIVLCDLCDNKTLANRFICDKCKSALDKCRKELSDHR